MIYKKLLITHPNSIDYRYLDFVHRLYDTNGNLLATEFSPYYEEYAPPDYNKGPTWEYCSFIGDNQPAYSMDVRYGLSLFDTGELGDDDRYTWDQIAPYSVIKPNSTYILKPGYINENEEIIDIPFETCSVEVGASLPYEYYNKYFLYDCSKFLEFTTWKSLYYYDPLIITNNIITTPDKQALEKIPSIDFAEHMSLYYLFTFTYEDGTKSYCPVTGHIGYSCLSIDTNILLADGTTKLYKDITIDNELLVWDFDNGCYTTAKLLWLQDIQLADHYFKCTTNTGKVLNCIGDNNKSHRLLSIEKGRFEYPQDIIGDTIYTTDGYEQLVSVEKINKPIYYRNAITNKHINLIGNSILTSCRLNNIYPIKDMKFIKDTRELRPREEFNEVSDNIYNGLRLSEQQASKEELLKYIKNLHSKGVVID